MKRVGCCCGELSSIPSSSVMKGRVDVERWQRQTSHARSTSPADRRFLKQTVEPAAIPAHRVEKSSSGRVAPKLLQTRFSRSSTPGWEGGSTHLQYVSGSRPTPPAALPGAKLAES